MSCTCSGTESRLLGSGSRPSSFIFTRRGNSWHGVRAINAPEGVLRKVFILVYEDAHHLKMFRKRLKRLLTGKSTNIEAERKQKL